MRLMPCASDSMKETKNPQLNRSQSQTKYIRFVIEFLRIRTLTAISGFIGHTHAAIACEHRSEASLQALQCFVIASNYHVSTNHAKIDQYLLNNSVCFFLSFFANAPTALKRHNENTCHTQSMYWTSVNLNKAAHTIFSWKWMQFVAFFWRKEQRN